MDIQKAIETRRSIRKYTSEPVSDEQLKKILNAAFCAPSAKNVRPWHFVAVRDKAKLCELAAAGPLVNMIGGAPLAIVVCADTTMHDTEPRMWCDIAAAAENMLLAAHGMGLGAVWCGCYPGTETNDNTRAILGLPGHIAATAIVVIGHPAEERDIPDRFEEEKLHWDQWS